MERREITNLPNIIKGRDNNTNFISGKFPLRKGLIKSNPVFEKLAEEGCEYYFRYLEWLGLSNDKNLLVLSSSHHYYYDAEDLKGIKTLVNLKQLNYIKQIKNFLHTIYHILPYKTYFIGSFIDGKTSKGFFSDSNKNPGPLAGKVDPFEIGITSRNPFLNLIYDIIDSRTNRYLTRKTVQIMLEDAGLKVLDMTDFNGLTYFGANKPKSFKE